MCESDQEENACKYVYARAQGFIGSRTVSGHFHGEATLSEAIVADEQANYLSVACLRTWENHLVEASLQIF